MQRQKLLQAAPSVLRQTTTNTKLARSATTLAVERVPVWVRS